MPKGDWKSEVQDMDFERYPKLEKFGTINLKFLDEGSTVQAKTTGYKEDSVVFVVEADGEKKELWMSKLHPILRQLADEKLTGKNLTMKFEGKGLDMRISIVK